MLRLRVTEAGESRVVDIRGDRAVIGRTPECEVEVQDGGVSRRHAEIELDGSTATVRDLGSSNGTFVNDEPVEQRRISPRDVVRLGPDVTIEWLADRATARATGDVDEDSISDAPRPGRTPSSPSEAPRARGWLTHTEWILEPRSSQGSPARIHRSVTSVGRDSAAGLVLDDESVSRMHARLDARGGRLFVNDLKSRNGTRVNGEPVLHAPLESGDHVRFGDVEFEVTECSGPAWTRIGGASLAIAVLGGLVFGVLWMTDTLGERAALKGVTRRVQAQAVESTRAAIAASREGDATMARTYLLHAADLLLLSGLAPRGASLDRPRELFDPIVRRLPESEREFDFSSALDPAVVASSRARVANLTNREYVEYKLRQYSVELGQDPQVPSGFVERVWDFVGQYEKYPGAMRIMLRRARDLQPRLNTILGSRYLPEAFCYVAWVESGLDPMQRSPVGAVGLWQLMPTTARERGLRVVETDLRRDERTDIDRSTAAAADFIATLLRDQGPEYFMLVLASYNRGPGALDRAKQKIQNPMLSANRKYWHLVEHNLLPKETRDYVPKIFAVRLVAEAPERFGIEAPR